MGFTEFSPGSNCLEPGGNYKDLYGVTGALKGHLVLGPEPLKCTNSRDQPRVVRICSLSEGDSKNS